METSTLPFPRGLQKAQAGPALQLTAIRAPTRALPPVLQNRTDSPAFPSPFLTEPGDICRDPSEGCRSLAALRPAAGTQSRMLWAGHGTVPQAAPLGLCVEPRGEDSFLVGLSLKTGGYGKVSVTSPAPLSRQKHRGPLMSKVFTGFSTALQRHWLAERW